MFDLSYFYTSGQAVIEIIFVALPGYYFTKNGALSQASNRDISSLNLNVLTPCLLFTKIVQNADMAMMLRLWIEPLAYILYTLVGLGFAWSSAKLFRLNSLYSRLVEVSVMFTNCNTLPYALIYSIATSPSSGFLLRDDDDTPEELGMRGITYAVIFGLANNIARFSLGTVWFQSFSTSPASGLLNPSIREVSTTAPTESSCLLGYRVDPISTSLSVEREVGQIHERPNSQSHIYDCLPVPGSSIAKRINGIIKVLLSPPIFSLLLGVAIIAIPPAQHFIRDRSSPFHSLWSALEMMGDTAIPVTIITLGAQLGLPVSETNCRVGSNDGGHEEDHAYQSVSITSTAANNTASNQTNTSRACSQGNSSHQGTKGPSINNTNDQILLGISQQPIHLPESHRQQSTTKTKKTTGITTASITSASSTTTTTTSKLSVSKRGRKVGIALVMAGRYLVVPAFAILCLLLMKSLWPTSTILVQFSSDPILLLVLLILGACPPSINLIMITQELSILELESAEILMWSYLSSTVILAIEMSGFLWLTREITGR